MQESKLFDSDGTNEFPDELTTDNGTEFTNEKFKALCIKYNIDQLYKTPGTHDIGTVDRAIGVWKKNHTENPEYKRWQLVYINGTGDRNL